jgi:DNA adenine methylase
MGSFNGKFFDGGYSGKTDKRDYVDEQIRNTLKQVEFLKDAIFLCNDYSYLDVPDNSIIYCDIPYKNTTQYATSKNFNYDNF